MKRITVRAFVKVISCRKITTQHIETADGTITKTECQMVEDAPVIVEVHEAESLESIQHVKKVTNEGVIKNECNVVKTKLVLSTETSQHQNDENSLSKNNIVTEEIQPSVVTRSNSNATHGKFPDELSSSKTTSMERSSEMADDSQDNVELPVVPASIDAVEKISDIIQSETAEGSSSKVMRTKEKDSSETNEKGNLLEERPHVARKRATSKMKSTFNKACRICGISFTTQKELTVHKKKNCYEQVSKEKNTLSSFITCDLCHAKFKSESLLKLHKSKVHCSHAENHTCSLCGRRFNSMSGFAKHKNLGTCNKSFTCNICGKVYENKARDSFKKHLNNHELQAEGKQFSCSKCGRSYMSQDALKKHMNTHLGIKPHSCTVCGKSFAMSYMVRDHMRTHTGIRAFLCNICGSSFSVSSHLARHLRSHSRGTLNKRGRPRKNSPDQDFQEKQVDIISRTENKVHVQCPDEAGHDNGQNKELNVQQSSVEYQRSQVCDAKSQAGPNYSDIPLTPYVNPIPHPDLQSGQKSLHQPDSLYESSFPPHYQEYHLDENLVDYHSHPNNYASTQLGSSIPRIPTQTAGNSINRNWATDLCQYTSEITEPSPVCKSSDFSAQTSHSYHMSFHSDNHTSLRSHHQGPGDSTRNMENVTLHNFPTDPPMMQGNVPLHDDTLMETDENQQESRSSVERKYLRRLDHYNSFS